MEALLPERIYTKEPLPDMAEIRNFIESKKALKAFDALNEFVLNNYYFEQEICYGGKKFGVMVRYRKNGKTLVSIFPEKNKFAVVLVYGKKEVILFESQRETFSPFIVSTFDETPQLHDGRWMLIRLEDDTYLPELAKMIMIKKAVKKKWPNLETV